MIARQSTALELAIGPVLDADGVAVTDCVVADFKVKKTTGNFAALNGSATLTHVSAGMYDLVLTTSDTDTIGFATIAIDDTVNGCAPVRLQVIEETVYDALYAASALGYVANAPVNVAQISGDSTAADNLETAFDDTAGAVPWTGIIDQGTAQSASATGLVLRSAAAFADDTLIGATISVFGSTQGYWQQRIITDSALSGDTVTVDTWTVTPSGTITYKIFATPPSPAGTLANIDAILADTNELQTDWANGGRLDVILDARASQTSVDDLPTNAELDARTLAAANYATAANLATVDGIVDDILVDTGTTLQAELDGIQADTEDIQTRLPAALTGAGNMKSDVLAINASTTAAANQSKAALAIYPGTVTTTGTITTLIDTGLTQVDDHWIGRVVIFLTGTLAYQATAITDFTASSDTLTFVALTSAPQASDTYIIV